MSPARRRLATAAVGAAAALAAAAAPAAPAPPVAVTVHAQPGRTAEAARSLAPFRVQRRMGRTLQVVSDPDRVDALGWLPGIAAAYPAPSSVPDVLESEGLGRTGAAVLGRVAGGARGVSIAILDQGFGVRLPQFQAVDELPPPGRLETMSFDTVRGLAGSNAYGSPTNHGELVAQTVYDYAPKSYYLFVNYDTEADFVAAADWLTSRRPDIVVHSNSFIEGPFDGTGPAARAVDRAAAAGILWFNSAGNYATKHWSGPWQDAAGDGVLDWPNGDAWTFAAGFGDTISFSLSWTPGAGDEPTDLDMTLERQDGAGWIPVAGSTDRQSRGAPAAERILGYAPEPAVYRLRVSQASGPPPAQLTLFSRELDLDDIGGSPTSSIPTPGDAAGSITVGAVDWRGNRFKRYSSQGPTDDGRLKPDLVAPTDTRVADRSGNPRRVGGTSNAAPNAAGAAAVMLAAARAAGQPVSAASLRQELAALALDLGEPGPDQVFGAGRVRLEVTPPKVVRPLPRALAAVGGRARFGFRALDRSRIVQWSVRIDGHRVKLVRGRDPKPFRLSTRHFEDGFHQVRAEALDLAGNSGAREWTIRVDNTKPLLTVADIETLGRGMARVTPGRGAVGPRAAARRRAIARLKRTPRPVRAVLAASDPDATERMSLRAIVATPEGRGVRARTFGVAPTDERRIALGRLRPGRYRLLLRLRDRAGNVRRVDRHFVVRPIRPAGSAPPPKPAPPSVPAPSDLPPPVVEQPPAGVAPPEAAPKPSPAA